MDKNYALQLNENNYITHINTKYGASIPIQILKEAGKICEKYGAAQITKQLKDLVSLNQKPNFVTRNDTYLQKDEFKMLQFNENDIQGSLSMSYDFYFPSVEQDQGLGLSKLKTKEEIDEYKNILKEAKKILEQLKEINENISSFLNNTQIYSNEVSQVKMKIKGHYKNSYYRRAIEVVFPISSALIMRYVHKTLNRLTKEAEKKFINIEDLKIIKQSNDLENFTSSFKTYALTAKYEDEYGFATRDYRKNLTKNLSDAFLFSSLLDIENVILDFKHQGLENIVPVEINLGVNFDSVLKQSPNITNPAFEALQSLGIKKQLSVDLVKFNSAEPTGNYPKKAQKHKI